MASTRRRVWMAVGLGLVLAGAIQRPAESLPEETLYSDTPRTGFSSNPYSVESGSPLISRLEYLLPVFVQVFDERLALLIEMVGEDHLTRKYSEQEFQEMVVQRVREMLPGQLNDIAVKIQPDGVVVTGVVRLESRSIPIQVRSGVTVVNDRLHLFLQDVQIGNRVASDEVRKMLETHVNQKLDRLRLLLKVKWVNLGPGWALLSVELANAT